MKCGTTFRDEQPLDGVRIETSQAAQVVRLLVEGVGIRAISRLTDLHQETVLNILAAAGQHCARLLDEKIRNVQVESVQVDELFCFVGCKQRNNTEQDYNRGDQYTFLAVDSASKLILSHVIGKRDSGNAHWILSDLNERVAGRFQLTTDSFIAYRNTAASALGDRVDFAQLMKLYSGNKWDLGPDRRYSPPVCSGIRRYVRSGTPDAALVSTSYVERTNLSVRLFNRRFTRLTLGYSKKIEYLKHSLALFVAHFNFCRKHSTLNATPAQWGKLTDHQWSVEELLAIAAPEKSPQQQSSGA